MNKKIIILIISILSLQMCVSPFVISDYYMVYNEYEGHRLMCKLGCDYDPFIDNVKSIKWDKKHIIVEQQENGQTNWYLIIASGEELRCCNRDTTISFNSKLELDRLIQKKNINVKKMKEKHFK